jgi:4-coumarate--CoA ligase
MIFESRLKLDIPFVDLLSWIFEGVDGASNRPIFLDAENPQRYLTASQLLSHTRAIGSALRTNAKVETGDVVLAYAGNSYIYPALVLGTLCAGAVFSGANVSFGQEGAS